MSNKIIQIKDGSDIALPEAGSFQNYSSGSTMQCTKFADGTMIQSGYTEIKSGSNSQIASSGVYFYSFEIGPFPVSFLSGSIISGYATTRCATGHILPAGVICSETAMGIMAYDFYTRTYTSAAPLKVYWMAIGRWK